MKKRLRKKFRTGEFTDYEFEVGFKMASPAGEAAVSGMLDAFLDHIESQGLSGGGSWSNDGDFSFYVSSRRDRGLVTEGHRQSVEAWLSGNPAVTGVTVSPLLDAHRDGE
jgi:uncharacterized protein YggL (DUF469 family)